MKRWLLQSGLFLAALLRRGGVEQNGKLTGKQLVVNLYSEIQITRVICVETSKKTKTKTNKKKKQKQHNNDLPQVLPLPFPRKKRGGGVGGGGGGGVGLIISQGQVNSIKVIASKSCVLLRYMKVRHQLIFITGVRLGSFLTIN